MPETCSCFLGRISANRSAGMAPVCIGRRHSAAVRASAAPVRVSFRLPYHCNFGQNLRLVGSGAPLGDWDVSSAAAMTWSDGDVWKADLEFELDHGSAIEYKYVVVGADGASADWKPGANISLLLPEIDASVSSLQQPRVRAVKIMDTWDGSSRGVEYEVEEGGQLLSSALAEAGLPVDSEISGVFLAMQNAIAELDEKMTRTLEVVESLEDPGAKEAVAGDKEVATAARKALSLAKAVDASREAKALGDWKPQGPI